MEEILLGNTGVFLRKFGKSLRIIIRKNTLYPYVDRESLRAVHSKKQYAFRNFRADALDLFQRFPSVVDRHSGDLRKISFSRIYAIYRVTNILCAKSAPQI